MPYVLFINISGLNRNSEILKKMVKSKTVGRLPLKPLKKWVEIFNIGNYANKDFIS